MKPVLTRLRGGPAFHGLRKARIGLAVLLVLFHPTLAGVITVDETNCTLVDAIIAANTDVAAGGCPPGSGADTIVLAADVALTAINSQSPEGFNDNGLPQVASEIILEGAGFVIERHEEAPPFRLIEVLPTGTLTLNDVTLRNGNAIPAWYPPGGALRNDGVTTVTNSTISGNAGGGLMNWKTGSLSVDHSIVSDTVGNGVSNGFAIHPTYFTLTNTTVSGSSKWGIYMFSASWASIANSIVTANAQGGISLSYGGRVTVHDSTVWGNQGVGISHGSYTFMTVSNSTISGNGIGIDTYIYEGQTAIRNSTIAGNAGNGLQFFALYDEDTIELSRCILADNGGANCDYYQTIVGLDNFTDDDTCPASQPIDGLDPNLAGNGGPTPTHALLPGSSAIDASVCSLDTDQRGRPRNDDLCDSGSYEFQCAIAVTKDEVNTLIWFTPDSSEFDIVAGYLSDLLADKDFSQATCLGTYLASPAVDTLPEPPVGNGRYYLARGLTSCVGAHYGDSSLTPDPRDALSVGPCP